MGSKIRAILIGISLLDLMGCGHLGVDQVWTIQASHQNLARASQTLDYVHANLFRCISASDFNRWLHAWSGCSSTVNPPQLDVAIFVLNPSLGLVRSQVSAIIPFRNADGYKCLSPDDFNTALIEYRKCYEK